MSKEISNSYSTGGGGIHFENNVQSAFALLMLTGGLSPCLPPWPITEIKLQGKYQGFETDDLIVYCKKPNTQRISKLLGQVKHSISFTLSDKTFEEVISAAWNDFNNKKVFSKEAGDVLALICGPLSGVDTESVRPLLEQARSSKDVNDFITRIEQGIFTSHGQRDKLSVFKTKLKIANNNVELTDQNLWQFLKSFHLLIYDLDIKGVVYSLLHTLIELHSRNNSSAVWAQINYHIQEVSERAGFITNKDFPEEIREAFKKLPTESIPDEFFQDTSKVIINNWNDCEYSADLALVCLIGSWNENIASDRSILSKFANLDYEKWIPKLREVLQYPDSPLEFKNGIWRIKDRLKLWQILASRIFDNHLEILRESAVLVLSELDPKFELPKEEQWAAQAHGKTLKYSPQIRKGLAETLALLGCFTSELKNTSSQKPRETVVLTIRDIFKDANSVMWASINDLLPILAEASPDTFIKIVDDTLKENPSLFDKLFALEGIGVTGSNYITGLLWSLETLAWEETHLVNVTILLGELAEIDPGGNWANRPSNSLTTIFLPWLPQTTASIEKRKVAVKTLNRDLPEISWKLLLSLLPNAHQVSSFTRKPLFRNFIPSGYSEKVTNTEYWEQVNFYAELAVENAKDNVEKLENLINNFDNLPKTVFEKILSHLSSTTVTSQPDEIKVNLWNALLDFTTKHKRFSDAKWALPAEIVSKIENVANKLVPQNLLYVYSRLFSKRETHLYEEKGNWEEQRKKLDQKRQEAIKTILNTFGIEEILKFVNLVEFPQNVGNALGAISNDLIDNKLLPNYLEIEDHKIRQFINSYVSRKYFVNGWDWVDKVLSKSWSKIQLARFLSFLPFIFETWNRVSIKLTSSESLYWETTTVNPYQAENHLSFAIDKLIKYGRPHAALDCLQKELYDKKPLNIEQALNALKAALKSKEPVYNMDTYNITEIIKALQDNDQVREDDLFNIEWSYLSLLDEHMGVTPKTLEFKLASDADFFCEVIRTVYRSKKDTAEEKKDVSEKEKAIATNAWHLLYKWKLIPGKQKNGSFNEEKFKEWLQTVKEKCTESGHLEIALQYAGKTLYYCPKDRTGFWINKIVANELNQRDSEELRRGFSLEVSNSRGAHFIDPTGKPELGLAEEYKTKSVETENAGYPRLAVTLREIAKSFEFEADRIKEKHNGDNNKE